MQINPEALRLEMKRNGMTNTASADGLGVSTKTISRILSCDRSPNAHSVEQIRRALDVLPEELATSPDDLRQAEVEQERAAQGLHRIGIALIRPE